MVNFKNPMIGTAFDDSQTIYTKLNALERRIRALEKDPANGEDNDRNVISFLNQYAIDEVTERPWFSENFVYNNYMNILGRYQSLMHQYPTLMREVEWGTDSGGRLLNYYVIPASANEGQWNADNQRRFTNRTLLIFTGVDGDDYASIITVFYKIRNILMGATEMDKYLKNNFDIVVAPCVNPYGIDYGRERNPNNIDVSANLNTPAWTPGDDRGSTPNSEKETQFIAALMDMYGNGTTSVGNTNRSYGNLMLWCANNSYVWWNNIENANQTGDYRFLWNSSNHEDSRHTMMNFNSWHMDLFRKKYPTYMKPGNYARNTVSTGAGNVVGYATRRGMYAFGLFPQIGVMNDGNRVDSDTMDINWIFMNNFFNSLNMYIGRSPRDVRFIYLSDIGCTNNDSLSRIMSAMPSTSILSVDMWTGDIGTTLANNLPSTDGVRWVGAGRLIIEKINAINNGLEIAYITYIQRLGTGAPNVYYAINNTTDFRGWIDIKGNTVSSVVPNPGGASSELDDTNVEDEIDPTAVSYRLGV